MVKTFEQVPYRGSEAPCADVYEKKLSCQEPKGHYPFTRHCVIVTVWGDVEHPFYWPLELPVEVDADD